MKDVYVDTFRKVIKQTQNNTGLEIPVSLEAYISIMLANFVEKNNILPSKGFSEYYLTLKNSQNAKELGDVCLFVTSVFPSFGESRYTVNKKYYSDIGISSYEKAAQNLNYEIFVLLSTNFLFLQKFIEISISSSQTGDLFNNFS